MSHDVCPTMSFDVAIQKNFKTIYRYFGLFFNRHLQQVLVIYQRLTVVERYR